MDTTVIYKRDGGTLVYRGYLAPNNSRCNVSYSYPAKADTVSQVLRASESRTLTRGDHLHSLPFTGTYVEQSPMAGTVTMDYRNTNASGPDKTACGTSAGSYMRYTGDVGYWFKSLVASELASDTVLESRLRGLSETKALADLHRSYYSLGIILAERGKTVSYIVDKCKQLLALVKARQTKDLARFYATRKRDRRRIAKDIANEHLGFMFGLLPLVDEIEGAANLLAEEQSSVLTGRGRQAKATLSRSVRTIRTFAIMSSNLPCALDCIDDTSTKYSVRTAIAVQVDIPAMQKMRDHGLNPIATFFDLVPLSFLLDFVSNTGTFLRSYDPLLGVKFITGSSTTWRERVIASTARGASHKSVSGSSVETVTGSGSGKARSRHLVVKRSVLSDYPQPTWLLQNNLSVAKAATLGSLAIQRYLKPVRSLLGKRPFRYRGPRPKYLPPIKYTR